MNEIYTVYSDQWAKISPQDVRVRLEKSEKSWSKSIGRFVPKDKSSIIIDVGCGYGDSVWNMQKNGFKNASGFDLSENQIQYGKLAGVENIFKSDALDALGSVEDEAIDCILMIDILEHIEDNSLCDILKESKRVLKKGGVMIIRVPNGRSPYVGSIRYGDLTHQRAFTEYSIAQIFTVVGMDNIKYFECAPTPIGFKSYLRLYFWKILRLVHVLHEAVETGYMNLNCVWTKNMIVVVTNE